MPRALQHRQRYPTRRAVPPALCSAPKPRDSVRAEAPERVKASKDAMVPRQPLALVAQPSEFPQLDLAKRGPTAEQKRHALIRSCVAVRSSFSSSSKRLPGRFSIIWGGTSQRPQAPAPYGALAGPLPRRPPNHFRILADKLRAICISTSLPPPSAQWPVRSRRKERLGRRNGSRYVAIDSKSRRCLRGRGQRG